jgi:heat shock protein HslJ
MLAESDSTGWILLALGDTPSLASVPVTLEIAGGGRITGWTGCNDFSATYESVGDAVFISDVVRTSDNACRSDAAQIQEDLYLTALEKIRSYQVSGAELSLMGANAEQIARFLSALTLELENTNWVAAAYDDGEGSLVPVSTEAPAITAILQANIISGFAGCANYQADYSVDGNTIQVSNLTGGAAGATSADCTDGGPTLDQDARYRKALQSAASYELSGPHLTFYKEDASIAVTYLAIAAIEQVTQPEEAASATDATP